MVGTKCTQVLGHVQPRKVLRQVFGQCGFSRALCTDHTDKPCRFEQRRLLACGYKVCAVHDQNRYWNVTSSGGVLDGTQGGVATQIGQQDRWHIDRAIGILVVLQYRHQSTPYSQS